MQVVPLQEVSTTGLPEILQLESDSKKQFIQDLQTWALLDSRPSDQVVRVIQPWKPKTLMFPVRELPVVREEVEFEVGFGTVFRVSPVEVVRHLS